jgi:hypothetical protein
MQPVLKPVLHARVPDDIVRLRPQIVNAIGPSKFECDQMIHFTADAFSPASVVACVDFALNGGWHGPDELGIARSADIRLRHAERRTRCKVRVGKRARIKISAGSATGEEEKSEE